MTQTGRRGEACFSLSALFASPFSRRPPLSGERGEEQPLYRDSPILLLPAPPGLVFEVSPAFNSHKQTLRRSVLRTL